MIVFADPSNMTVIVAGKTVEKFHFSDIDEIEKRISGHSIIWVTNAARTTSNNVIALLKNHFDHITENTSPPPRTGRMLMHSNVENQLIINGPNGFSLIFTDPLDFKDLSVLPSNIFDAVPNLRKALDVGKIAIIDEADKNLVRTKFSKFIKKQEERRRKKEEQINGILIDSNVKASDFAASGGFEDDNMMVDSNDIQEDSEESLFIKKYNVK